MPAAKWILLGGLIGLACGLAGYGVRACGGQRRRPGRFATRSLDLPVQLLSDGIYLKREDEHELGAFKWRGAQAVLEQLRPPVVVTASTGNHGAATAWAAKRAGVRAIVFVPREASAAKVALIEEQGAELYRTGADVDEAKAAARAYAAEHDAFFFEDGAEPAHSTATRRSATSCSTSCPRPRRLSYRSERRACHRRLPCLPERARRAARRRRGGGGPAMWESWRAGAPIDSDRCSTFADGLAARVAIPLAVAELNPLVQQFELVSEVELEQACALMPRPASGSRVRPPRRLRLRGGSRCRVRWF